MLQMRVGLIGLALTLMFAGTASAQTPLTLTEAMARARTATPEARGLEAAAGEAAARTAQARAGYLPRVDVGGTLQRGNQPVFVFGSLLAQRRFGAEDFALQSLNHPRPVTNVKTTLLIEQPIYDGGAARLAVRGARIGSEVSAAERRRAEQDLAMGAATAFVRVLQLEAEIRATVAAIDAALSDLERAKARRDGGLATEADVLAVDVHLAEMRARRIEADGDLAVARIALNAAIGAPLDQAAPLVMPAVATPPRPIDELVAVARQSRSERHAAMLRAEGAATTAAAARAALLPQVALQGGLETNGSALTDQQSSWMVGATVHVNVFRGGADAARVREARYAQTRAEADRQQVERGIEVDVRAAAARVNAAHAREQVGRAALAQARESQRIIRDRYDAGLATMTDVLRAAGAVVDAESRASAAALTVTLETVALDRATGAL